MQAAWQGLISRTAAVASSVILQCHVSGTGRNQEAWCEAEIMVPRGESWQR